MVFESTIDLQSLFPKKTTTVPQKLWVYVDENKVFIDFDKRTLMNKAEMNNNIGQLFSITPKNPRDRLTEGSNHVCYLGIVADAPVAFSLYIDVINQTIVDITMVSFGSVRVVTEQLTN